MRVTDGNGFKSQKSDWTSRKSETSFSPPFLEKDFRQRVDPKEGVVGQRSRDWEGMLRQTRCSAVPSPPPFGPVAFFSRGKTRGEGGNALTMRNGRCCVFARDGAGQV